MLNIQQTVFYTLLSLPLTYFLAQYLHTIFQTATKYKIILYLLAFIGNPYIYRLMIADPLDSIQLCFLALFVVIILNRQYRECSWSFMVIGIASGLNPSNGLIAVQGLIITKDHRKKKLLLFVSTFILSALVLFFWKGLISYYRQMYFPQVFTPQFNLTWILYSHMFERYLLLYQLTLIIIPIYTLYLVNHIQIPSELQIITLLFINIFCHYKCSELYLVFSMFLQVLVMLKFVPKLSRQQEKVNKDYQVIKIKLMNLLIVVVEISFFFLTKIFLQRYLNDFTMQMGHVLIYRAIFWCCRSVYLSEMILSATSLEKELAKITYNSTKRTNLSQVQKSSFPSES